MQYLCSIGRHCCLWCHIRSDQLKLQPASRGPIQPRSTHSIVSDHDRFMAAGGNIKNAKSFNNCISRPFFPQLYLSQVCTYKCHEVYTFKYVIQVCPPGLHLTLGIFYHLFKLLEDACHQLDLIVKFSDSRAGGSYEQYLNATRQQTILKENEERLTSQVEGMKQLIT